MKRVFAFALILGAFVTLLGLGTWQMQRMAWKENLIAQAEMRPTLPPVSITDVLALPSDAWAYRTVAVEGRFVGEPVRVFTTLSDANGPLEGPGYWLMQAFESATGTVFVNRGFIPFETAPELAIRDAPTGVVQFEGLVRPDDEPDFFTPEPDYEGNVLYRRSIAQLVEAAGVPEALPVTIDMPASAAGGLPQAGETKFTFSNRHFEYMLTWYGLAAVLLGVVGTAWWRRRRA